jgi:hypothetical protein
VRYGTEGIDSPHSGHRPLLARQSYPQFEQNGGGKTVGFMARIPTVMTLQNTSAGKPKTKHRPMINSDGLGERPKKYRATRSPSVNPAIARNAARMTICTIVWEPSLRISPARISFKSEISNLLRVTSHLSNFVIRRVHSPHGPL